VVTAGTLFGNDSLTGGNFAFDSKNAGTGKTVTVAGVTVNDGNGGLNYKISNVSNSVSSIIVAALTVSTADVVKTYDGTTSAVGTPVPTAGTLFAGDSLSGGSYAFDSKNAGSGKTVSVSGIAVNDGNGGLNYKLSDVNNTSSTINKATISAVAGITAAGKMVDNSTGATIDTSLASFGGKVTGDDLNVATAVGTFADAAVGFGKTVSISGISLGGADAGNYKLLSTFATTTADIKPLPGGITNYLDTFMDKFQQEIRRRQFHGRDAIVVEAAICPR
jgi:hypothetical protein